MDGTNKYNIRDAAIFYVANTGNVTITGSVFDVDYLFNNGTDSTYGFSVTDSTVYVRGSTASTLRNTGSFTFTSSVLETERVWNSKTLTVTGSTFSAASFDNSTTASTAGFTNSTVSISGTVTNSKTFTVTGSTFSAASFNNSTTASTAGFTNSTVSITNAITNSGTIAVNASTVSATTVTTNANGDKFTVSGASKLNIGTLTGTINLLNDAEIQDSTITSGGTLNVAAGNGVTFSTTGSNTNSFSGTAITNFGTITVNGELSFGTLTNSGTINLDKGSTIRTSGSFSGGNTLNLTLSGDLEDDTVYTLISAAGGFSGGTLTVFVDSTSWGTISLDSSPSSTRIGDNDYYITVTSNELLLSKTAIDFPSRETVWISTAYIGSAPWVEIDANTVTAWNAWMDASIIASETDSVYFTAGNGAEHTYGDVIFAAYQEGDASAVTLYQEGTGVVTLGAFSNGSGKSVTVDDGASLVFSGAIGNSGTLTVNGTLTANGTFANSGTITVNGSLTANGGVTNSGTITVNAGSNFSAGTFTNNSGASFKFVYKETPTITVDSFTNASGATLNIDISAFLAGSADSATISGLNITNSGTIRFWNGANEVKPGSVVDRFNYEIVNDNIRLTKNISVNFFVNDQWVGLKDYTGATDADAIATWQDELIAAGTITREPDTDPEKNNKTPYEKSEIRNNIPMSRIINGKLQQYRKWDSESNDWTWKAIGTDVDYVAEQYTASTDLQSQYPTLESYLSHYFCQSGLKGITFGGKHYDIVISSSGNYSSWANAFGMIQGAVNVSADGDTIVFYNLNQNGVDFGGGLSPANTYPAVADFNFEQGVITIDRNLTFRTGSYDAESSNYYNTKAVKFDGFTIERGKTATFERGVYSLEDQLNNSGTVVIGDKVLFNADMVENVGGTIVVDESSRLVGSSIDEGVVTIRIDAGESFKWIERFFGISIGNKVVVKLEYPNGEAYLNWESIGEAEANPDDPSTGRFVDMKNIYVAMDGDTPVAYWVGYDENDPPIDLTGCTVRTLHPTNEYGSLLLTDSAFDLLGGSGDGSEDPYTTSAIYVKSGWSESETLSVKRQNLDVSSETVTIATDSNVYSSITEAFLNIPETQYVGTAQQGQIIRIQEGTYQEGALTFDTGKRRDVILEPDKYQDANGEWHYDVVGATLGYYDPGSGTANLITFNHFDNLTLNSPDQYHRWQLGGDASKGQYSILNFVNIANLRIGRLKILGGATARIVGSSVSVGYTEGSYQAGHLSIAGATLIIEGSTVTFNAGTSDGVLSTENNSRGSGSVIVRNSVFKVTPAASSSADEQKKHSVNLKVNAEFIISGESTVDAVITDLDGDNPNGTNTRITFHDAILGSDTSIRSGEINQNRGAQLHFEGNNSLDGSEISQNGGKGMVVDADATLDMSGGATISLPTYIQKPDPEDPETWIYYESTITNNGIISVSDDSLIAAHEFVNAKDSSLSVDADSQIQVNSFTNSEGATVSLTLSMVDGKVVLPIQSENTIENEGTIIMDASQLDYTPSMSSGGIEIITMGGTGTVILKTTAGGEHIETSAVSAGTKYTLTMDAPDTTTLYVNGEWDANGSWYEGKNAGAYSYYNINAFKDNPVSPDSLGHLKFTDKSGKVVYYGGNEAAYGDLTVGDNVTCDELTLTSLVSMSKSKLTFAVTNTSGDVRTATVVVKDANNKLIEKQNVVLNNGATSAVIYSTKLAPGTNYNISVDDAFGVDYNLDGTTLSFAVTSKNVTRTISVVVKDSEGNQVLKQSVTVEANTTNVSVTSSKLNSSGYTVYYVDESSGQAVSAALPADRDTASMGALTVAGGKEVVLSGATMSMADTGENGANKSITVNSADSTLRVAPGETAKLVLDVAEGTLVRDVQVKVSYSPTESEIFACRVPVGEKQVEIASKVFALGKSYTVQLSDQSICKAQYVAGESGQDDTRRLTVSVAMLEDLGRTVDISVRSVDDSNGDTIFTFKNQSIESGEKSLELVPAFTNTDQVYTADVTLVIGGERVTVDGVVPLTWNTADGKLELPIEINTDSEASAGAVWNGTKLVITRTNAAHAVKLTADVTITAVQSLNYNCTLEGSETSVVLPTAFVENAEYSVLVTEPETTAIAVAGPISDSHITAQSVSNSGTLIVAPENEQATLSVTWNDTDGVSNKGSRDVEITVEAGTTSVGTYSVEVGAGATTASITSCELRAGETYSITVKDQVSLGTSNLAYSDQIGETDKYQTLTFSWTPPAGSIANDRTVEVEVYSGGTVTHSYRVKVAASQSTASISYNEGFAAGSTVKVKENVTYQGTGNFQAAEAATRKVARLEFTGLTADNKANREIEVTISGKQYSVLVEKGATTATLVHEDFRVGTAYTATIKDGDATSTQTCTAETLSYFTAGAVTNTGTIEVADASFTATSVNTTNGTFNVSGYSTLKIGNAAEGNKLTGTITVANGATLNDSVVYGDGNKATVDITGSGSMSFAGTSELHGVNLSVTGELTNTGSLTVDVNSLITANTIDNTAGTITVDATGYIGGEAVKVIDVDGGSQNPGTFDMTRVSATNLSSGWLIQRVSSNTSINRDVYLIDYVDQTVLYVNSAWEALGVGQQLYIDTVGGEGVDLVDRYYGINAFSNIYDALTHLASTTTTINVISDNTFTTANETYQLVNVAPTQSLTIQTDPGTSSFTSTINFKSADMTLSPANGKTVTVGQGVTITGNDTDGNSCAYIVLNYAGSTGDVVIEGTVDSESEVAFYGNSTVGATGRVVSRPETFENDHGIVLFRSGYAAKENGQAVVFDLNTPSNNKYIVSITGDNEFTAPQVNSQLFLLQSGVLSIKNSKVESLVFMYGQSDGALSENEFLLDGETRKAVLYSDNTEWNFTSSTGNNGYTFDAGTTVLQNGELDFVNESSVNVAGNAIVGNLVTLNLNDSGMTVAGNLANAGAITLADSELTAGSVTNTGTINLNVGSTLKAASVSGGIIHLDTTDLGSTFDDDLYILVNGTINDDTVSITVGNDTLAWNDIKNGSLKYADGAYTLFAPAQGDNDPTALYLIKANASTLYVSSDYTGVDGTITDDGHMVGFNAFATAVGAAAAANAGGSPADTIVFTAAAYNEDLALSLDRDFMIGQQAGSVPEVTSVTLNSLSVTGTTEAATTLTVAADTNLIVSNSITLDGNTSLTNSGSLTVNGTLTATDNTVTNSGTITVTAAANAIVADSITNTGDGKIVLVLTDYTGTVIDVNAKAGLSLSNIEVSGDFPAGASLLQKLDGDICIGVVDKSTLFVNSAWTGLEGEEVATGKYFGINAFSSFTEALTEAARVGSTSISIATGSIEDPNTVTGPLDSDTNTTLTAPLTIGALNDNVTLNFNGSNDFTVTPVNDAGTETPELVINADITTVGPRAYIWLNHGRSTGVTRINGKLTTPGQISIYGAAEVNGILDAGTTIWLSGSAKTGTDAYAAQSVSFNNSAEADAAFLITSGNVTTAFGKTITCGSLIFAEEDEPAAGIAASLTSTGTTWTIKGNLDISKAGNITFNGGTVDVTGEYTSTTNNIHPTLAVGDASISLATVTLNGATLKVKKTLKVFENALLTVKGTSTLTGQNTSAMTLEGTIATDSAAATTLTGSNITGKVSGEGALLGIISAGSTLNFTGTNTLTSIDLSAASKTVTNSGTLTVVDSTLTAGSVTNGGTLNIGSGESTLNIGTLSGTIELLDGATIKDSTVSAVDTTNGGKLSVAADKGATFSGTNDFAAAIDNYGSITINNTMTSGAIDNKIAAASITVNGTLNSGTINNSGVSTSSGGITVIGTLNSGVITNSGTITVSGTLNSGTNTITNTGTISINTIGATPAITATNIANTSGSITIDAGAYTGTDLVKVIDVANDATLTLANISLASSAPAGVRLLQGEDKDIYVGVVDQSTLYVNGAWSGAYGEEVATGKYFGINAFSSIAEAMGEAVTAESGTITLETASDLDHLNVNLPLEFTESIEINGGKTATIDFAGGKDLILTMASGKTFTFAENTTLKTSGADGYIVLAGAGTYDINGTLDSVSQVAFWGNATVGTTGRIVSEYTAPNTGMILFRSAKSGVENAAVTVNGAANQDTNAVQVDGSLVLLVSGVLNTTNTAVNATVLRFTQNLNEAGEAMWASEVAPGGSAIAGKTFVLNSTNTDWTIGSIEAGHENVKIDGIFNFAGDTIEISGDVNLGSKITLNLTDVWMDVEGAIDNAGTIRVNASTVSAASVDNDGTFTVGGTSELHIGTLDGTIATDSAAATTLTNSSITGKVSGEGALLGTISAGNTLNFTGTNTLTSIDLSAASKTVTNSGTLTVVDSTLTAGTVTNGGTLNIGSGESTLNIGTLSGTIELLDGATIKASSITSGSGKLNVAAGNSVTFSGTNTFHTVTNSGSITISGIAASGDDPLAEGYIPARSGHLTVDSIGGSISIAANVMAGEASGTKSYQVIAGDVSQVTSITNNTDYTDVVLSAGLYLTSQTQTTLFVDQNYTTIGAIVGDGLIVGYNAFGKASDTDNPELGVSSQISFATTDIQFAAGNYAGTLDLTDAADEVTITVTGEGTATVGGLTTSTGKTVNNTGSLTVNGTVNADVITNSGTLTVNGNGAVGAITNTDGKFTVSSGAVVSSGDITYGTIEVDGELNAESITSSTITVDGELNAESITSSTITVDGELNAESITSSTITVDGGATLNADSISSGTTITVSGTVSTAATPITVTAGAGHMISNSSIVFDLDYVTGTGNTITIVDGTIGNNVSFFIGDTAHSIAENGTVTIDDTQYTLVTKGGTGVFLTQEDQSILYVYATEAQAKNAHVYGYNSFNSFLAALDVAKARTAANSALTTIIEVVSSPEVTEEFSDDLHYETVKGLTIRKAATTEGDVVISLMNSDGTARNDLLSGSYTINDGVNFVITGKVAPPEHTGKHGGGFWLNFNGQESSDAATVYTDLSASAMIGFQGTTTVSNTATLTAPHIYLRSGGKTVTITGKGKSYYTDSNHSERATEYQIDGRKNTAENIDGALVFMNGQMEITGSNVWGRYITFTNDGWMDLNGPVKLDSVDTIWTIDQDMKSDFYGSGATNQNGTTGVFGFTGSTLGIGGNVLNSPDTVGKPAMTINLDHTTMTVGTYDYDNENDTLTVVRGGNVQNTGIITMENNSILIANNYENYGTISISGSTVRAYDSFANYGIVTVSDGATFTAEGTFYQYGGLSSKYLSVTDATFRTGTLSYQGGSISVNGSDFTVTSTEQAAEINKTLTITSTTSCGSNVSLKNVSFGTDGAISMDWRSTLSFTGFGENYTDKLTINMAGLNLTGYELSRKLLLDSANDDWTEDQYRDLLSENTAWKTDTYTLVVLGGDLYVQVPFTTVYVTPDAPSDDPDPTSSKPEFDSIDASTNVSPSKIVVEKGSYGAITYFKEITTEIYDTTQSVTAPEFSKGVFAGSYVTSQSGADLGHSISMTVNDGSFAKIVMGGDRIASSSSNISIGSNEVPADRADITVNIHDGTFSTTVVAGDRLESGGFTRYGDVTLNIDGGQFASTVAGGQIFSETTESKGTGIIDGNVSVNISGGEFGGWLYGGSIANTKENGVHNTIKHNVTTTIDASSNAITLNNVVAGSYGRGEIKGNAALVLKGVGDNLTVNGQIWGGCTGDYYEINDETGDKTMVSLVKGDRILSFTGFDGELNCTKIKQFSHIGFTGDSDVILNNNGVYDLSEVSNWTFENGSTLAGNFKNDFAGDTLNLNEFTAGDYDLITDLVDDAKNTFNGFGSLLAIRLNDHEVVLADHESTATTLSWSAGSDSSGSWLGGSLAIVDGTENGTKVMRLSLLS